MTEPQIMATYERVYNTLNTLGNSKVAGDIAVAAAILTKLIHETVYTGSRPANPCSVS